MTGSTGPAVQFTHNDIDLGLRLYEALVRQATTAQGAPISYSDLLAAARHLHPRDEALGRAVPVGIGAKLRFIESFCASYACPNLASLAVSRDTMRPHSGYTGNWEADRLAAASFDWPAVDAQTTAFAAAARARIPARIKPRKERPADVAWYAYFCSHRQACATLTQEDKQEIINLLMAGLDPDTALARVLAAKAEFGGQT